MVDNKNSKDKVETVLTDATRLSEVTSSIDSFTVDERRELRTILNSYERLSQIKTSISADDVKTLLNLLDKKEDNIELFNTNELRPIPFSKTVTVFDVYVTDEENFVPYVSQLATVGSVNSSSSSTSTTDIGDESVDINDIASASSTGTDSSESKGVLGFLGF